MSRIAALLLLVAGATPVVAQSRTPEPSGPNLKKIVTFDSGTVGAAALSPNGRWVAFDAAGSLWTAAADGRGRAARLTSPGYFDRMPHWFPSSDALTFTSNRPSRSGTTRSYGMTIAIDTTTGRAASQPRAVTTDEVSRMGHASPDGKWIAYVTVTGDSIKIVPSTGGTAKFVATSPTGWSGVPTWNADGRSIMFAATQAARPAFGTAYTVSIPATWYRVPASGGTPVVVEHAPLVSSLHLHGQLEQPLKRVELRDSTERAVSTIDVPPGMMVAPINSTNATVGTMSAKRYVSHIYSVETGAHRVIDNWADGWTGDGKNYLVELTDVGPAGSPGRAIAVGVQDNSGKILTRTALGPDAGGCCGWFGTVGTSLTFGHRSTKGMFVADAQSGRVRQLVPDAGFDAWAMPLFGRGGQGFSDGNRFLYWLQSEQALEARAVDIDGKSTLLRSFSTKDSTWLPKYHNGGHGIGVAGDRIAWTDRTHDSITVWVARGPTGAARRVAAFASPDCSGDRRGLCHTEVIWSQRSDALALVTMDEQPLAVVLRVRSDGTLDGAPTVLKPNVRQPWGVRWVDGDRALVMTGRRDRTGDDIVVVPISGAATRVLTQGQAGEWMWVSPDGKEILFPEVMTIGSSIWRLDFAPPNATTTGNAKR